ncbi:MAG: hypothetical protein BSOLF_2894 [Candidatus Carbobacillus altaicus]|uniref:Uncharacterized protein n=1 Tax=Candidatus Carbonibacillus altaicus TaxID=2163959 RepID=A0A2R6Y1R5_9BACL|nr:MAG: hypothetical protein BSOLF_2894 [Candidatus Carbobacillus altaicus]
MQAGDNESSRATSPLIEQVMGKIREETPWAYPDAPDRKKRLVRRLQVGMGVLIGLVMILGATLYQQGNLSDVQNPTEDTLSPALIVGSMAFAEHRSLPPEDGRLSDQFLEALVDVQAHAFYRPYWPTVTMNVSLIMLLLSVFVVTIWLIWWFRRTE